MEKRSIVDRCFIFMEHLVGHKHPICRVMWFVRRRIVPHYLIYLIKCCYSRIITFGFQTLTVQQFSEKECKYQYTQPVGCELDFGCYSGENITFVNKKVIALHYDFRNSITNFVVDDLNRREIEYTSLDMKCHMPCGQPVVVECCAEIANNVVLTYRFAINIKVWHRRGNVLRAKYDVTIDSTDIEVRQHNRFPQNITNEWLSYITTE